MTIILLEYSCIIVNNFVVRIIVNIINKFLKGQCHCSFAVFMCYLVEKQYLSLYSKATTEH